MLSYKNHSEKLQQIINGELSLRENVAHFLQRISDNSHLNAFNQVFAEDAIHQAETIQQKIKDREHGKLAGLVVAVKDVLSIKDKLTTCSSNILKNFTSIYTANAVQKLIDEDAIIIGKTNCDEFAMGSSNENSVFGPVRNPADNERETALSTIDCKVWFRIYPGFGATLFYVPAAGRSANGNEVNIPIIRDELLGFTTLINLFFYSFTDKILKSVAVNEDTIL